MNSLRKLKRNIAIILSLVFIISCVSPMNAAFAATCTSADEKWEYTLSDGKATDVKPTDKMKDTVVSIPSMIDTYPVVSIAAYAFISTPITSITIPDTVTSIGSGAFEACGLLTSVTIPSSVTSIGNDAFKCCSGLTSITIPSSVTSIGSNAFDACTGLTSITIPSSVTSIGAKAFDNTQWLAAQQATNPLVIVNDILVDATTATGDVIIPNNVKNITGKAFYSNANITSVRIPDGITYIDAQTFLDCTKLVSAFIPSSVTAIGGNAFQGSGLTTVKGYTGSYAQTWASTNGKTFVPIVATIGGADYFTLQAAVDAVNANGQTIVLQSDISLTVAVDIKDTNHYNFNLDLNGKRLSMSGFAAILHRGTGTLTIADSGTGGTITSNADISRGTIYIYGGGRLVVTGGTIENTEDASAALLNYNGTINVQGGTISSTKGHAIYSFNSSVISISSGIVQNMSSYFTAVLCNSSGAVNISGGEIRSPYIAITKNDGSVVISGSPVIRGTEKAMSTAPDLSGYTHVKVTASGNYDGSTPVSKYIPANINNYKYLTFAPLSDNTPVSSLNLTDQLTVPVVGGTPVSTFDKDDQFSGSVSWSTTPSTFLGSTIYTATITLTAKPCYTFTGVNQNAFSYTGATSVTNEAGSGNTIIVTIQFPATAAKAVQSITIIHYPNQVDYFIGDTLNTSGMIVRAEYNDGTFDNNFTAYTVDKTNPIMEYESTATVSATANPSITTTFPFTVHAPTQPISGTVTISGGNKFNQTLTASYTPNDGDNGTLTYQWKRDDSNIGTNSSSYTLVEADINHTITCRVRSSHRINSITSNPTVTIVKAVGPVVTGVAAVNCMSSGNNDGKLTGVTDAMEYKLSGAAGYTSGTGSDVTGLTNGSYLVRMKETTTHNAGTDSTFTVGAYVPPTTDNGNSNNNTGTVPKKEGKIEKDQKKDEKAPTANLNDSTEDLKSKVLSTAEQEQLATGKDVKVILKVEDISSSVSAEDKKKIEEKLTAEQQNITDTVLLYVDISLFKKVGDAEETRVTETNGKIKVSIEVPESMWSTEAGADRTYRVIRMHNGVAEILNGTYDPATHLFTFETDRFSTYALTYQDGNTTPATNTADTTQADQLTVVQDFNHLRLTAQAAKTSQKLTYAKVSKADGYLIYGAKYDQKLKKLADVDKTVTSYTTKKLKQGTYYKYQVKAYQMIDGKQVIIMTSNVIYSVTESKTYANPTKVTVDVASIKLAVGESKTVSCQVVMPEGKKLKQHSVAIRYEASNKKVATVDSKGKITAKAKGICYVYAYAQNGVYKKIKVTVK